MTEINWRFDKPSEAEVADGTEVLVCSEVTDVPYVRAVQSVREFWRNKIYAWAPMPEKPEQPERKFFDGTTYSKPGMWIDQDDMLWFGPGLPDSNLHFATLDGFTDTDHQPIWVYRASELPDGDYQRVHTTRVRPVERPKPKRREEFNVFCTQYEITGHSRFSERCEAEHRKSQLPNAWIVHMREVLQTDPAPEAIEEVAESLRFMRKHWLLTDGQRRTILGLINKLNPQTKP